MGTRERAAGLDFSGVLEEEVEGALKEAAQISMGTEISVEDLENIRALADQARAVCAQRLRLVCRRVGWVYALPEAAQRAQAGLLLPFPHHLQPRIPPFEQNR